MAEVFQIPRFTMSFYLIEKITHLEPKQSATGVKSITAQDMPYCQDGTALMPFMLLEGIGQLCAWIVMQHNQFSLRPIAILYRQLDVFGSAKIGEVVTFETHLKALDDKTSLFDGTAKVG